MKNILYRPYLFLIAIFGSMECFEIDINGQLAGHFDGAELDMAALLDELFVPGTANYGVFSLELQREFRQGGSPDVTRLAFDRVVYNAATRSGSFRVLLDIRFTFGCEDSVTEKEDQTSEWTYSIDALNKSIRFCSSPFAESRSTADEF